MAEKYDVLAIGELNVDLILTGMNTLPQPGREIIADGCVLTMGSSTAICASGLAKLGLKTGFAGRVGDDSYGRPPRYPPGLRRRYFQPDRYRENADRG